MRKRKGLEKAYAFAMASYEYGYGHVTIHVHELFEYGSSATLKISCQTGGTLGGSYAWQHGLSNDMSVIGLAELKRGSALLQRAAKALSTRYAAEGEPTSFADYALRVLEGMGIHKLHVLESLNSRHYRELSELPTFDLWDDDRDARALLEKMESALIARG